MVTRTRFRRPTAREQRLQARGRPIRTVVTIAKEKQRVLGAQRQALRQAAQQQQFNEAQRQTQINSLINRFNDDIRSFNKEIDNARDDLETETSKSRIIREEVKIFENKKRIEETRKLISDVTDKGLFYDYNEANAFTKNIASAFGDVKKKQLVQQIVVAPQLSGITPLETKELTTRQLVTDFGDALTSNVSKAGFMAKDVFIVNGKPQRISIDPRKVLTTKKLKQIRQLPKDQQDRIFNYATIKASVEQAKGEKLKELRKTSELSTALLKDKALNIKSNKDLMNLFKKEIPKTLSVTDIKNINRLSKLTRSDIINIIDKNDFKNVSNQINSLNKISDINENALKNISEKYANKIIKDFKGILSTSDNLKSLNKSNTNPFITKRFEAILKGTTKSFRVAMDLFNLIDIDKKLKGKQSITALEYNNYKRGLNDILGIKTLTKQNLEKIKKNFGNDFALGVIRTIKDIGRFAYKSGNEVKRIVIRDAILLYDLAVNVAKPTGRALKDLTIETIKFGDQILKTAGLNTKDKYEAFVGKEFYNKTFKRAKKIASGVKTAAELGLILASNPTVVLIGALGLLATGTTILRKTLIERPQTVFGEIMSFFVDDFIIDIAGTVGRVTEAVLSPFVLRGVDILETGASVPTTAKALQKLQGKKVNLFSTTTTKLKDLFKGSPISKVELDFLIKDMIKNPTIYIGQNLKIQPLKTIAKTKQQRLILDLIKKKGNAFLSGSAALKVQLKKFRKIGDFDVVVKGNLKKYGDDLVKQLNKTTFSGKGYRAKKLKTGNIEVFYKKKQIIDLVPIERVELELGRKVAAKDLVSIEGLKLLKAEVLAPLKIKVTQKPLARIEKEIKDLKIIFRNAQKKLSDKQYNAVFNLLNKEKGVLKVIPQPIGAGRAFTGARVKLGRVELPLASNKKVIDKVIKKLKAKGFSEARIQKLKEIYGTTGFFFAPDNIYTYYLRQQKGNVIFVKNQRIAKFPKEINELINKNVAGKLSNKEYKKLVGFLDQYTKANPNKVFPGQRALVDLIGEKEVIAPVYTKFFPKKTLVKRKVYLPIADQFIRVTEVVIGKKPKPLIQRLITDFTKKLKKGYKVSDMKRDIKKWAKINIEDLKKLSKSKKAQLNFIKEQQKLIDDQIDIIRKSKLSAKDKRIIINSLQDRRKVLRVTKRRPKKTIVKETALVRNIVRDFVRKPALRTSLRVAREIRRPVVRKVVRKVRKVVTKPRKVVREVKRVSKPRVRAVKRPTTRPRPRPIVRPRVTPRPRPPKPRPPKPIKPKPRKVKVPRIRLDWDSKLDKGEHFIVNAIVRVKGKNKELPLKTTPNRALKKIIPLIDNTTSRSFQLKILGKKKIDEIKSPNLFKFRKKKSKGTPVLKLVEKSKHAIDTSGERKGLKLGKALKRSSRRKNGKSLQKTKRTTKKTNKARKRRRKTSKITKSKSKKT